MTIYLLVEGKTEAALKNHIKGFLDQRAELANKAKVRLNIRQGMSPSMNVIRKEVHLLLNIRGTKAVVGLIDVFPHFQSAQKAKDFLRQAVPDEPRFYAHAAQFDVEAWLLPFWDDICQELKIRQASPGGNPEMVNSLKPPSKHLEELYQKAGRKYTKSIGMADILRGKDLTVSARQCSELKAMLNTLLTLHNLTPL